MKVAIIWTVAVTLIAETVTLYLRSNQLLRRVGARFRRREAVEEQT